MQIEFVDQPDPRRRYLCRHIFTDGHRCGSPALRGQHFCYYHRRARREPAAATGRADRPAVFTIPAIDDRAAIQLALREVLTRIAAAEIDNKRAGLLLYGLQVAALNLPAARPIHARPSKHASGAPFMERSDMSGIDLHSPDSAQLESPTASLEPVVEEITVDAHLGDLAPLVELPSESQPDPQRPLAAPTAATTPDLASLPPELLHIRASAAAPHNTTPPHLTQSAADRTHDTSSRDNRDDTGDVTIVLPLQRGLLTGHSKPS